MQSDSSIVAVNPLEDDAWDKKLETVPAASFFHGRAWAQVLHATYGFRPVYFVAEAGPGQRSLLPMMEVDSWLTGRRGVSLPFTDGCEALGPDRAARQRLMQHAFRFGAERRWRYCELRGRCDDMPAATASSEYYGHHLDLRGGPDQLFAGCSPAVRRAVRKGEASGVQLEMGHDLEAVRAFYRLMCHTRRRFGLPPQPWRFFANVHKHILAQHAGCVVLARWAGRPIAGAVFFHAGSTALYKYGASDDAFQHLRGNNLVMWRAIAWHARQGFSSLDFGRTDLGQEGLRRFKLSWGATEQRVAYVKFDCRHGNFFPARSTPAIAGWQNRLFRLAPLMLGRAAGSFLYRHAA